MVDQLKSIIEQVVSKEVSKSSIDTNLTSQVAQETGTTLFNGLSGALQQGHLNEIMSLFNDDKSNLNSNPMVGQIITNLTSSLGSKFGIDAKQASGFASTIIPMVINLIGSKAKSGTDGFNVTDLISGLSGSKDGGLLNSLGLDKNGDGKVDLKDAISALTNDDKNSKKDGLGGLLGGLFGK